ncbi:MAG TPA: hypothetical protein PLG86_06830 [Bacteroidales bacterium]|nr:hypothetical protein [Bacteroidales bacterium]
MKAFKYIASTLLVIALIAAGLLWYIDFFARFVVVEKIVGPYTMVYREVTGDKTNSSDVMNQLFSSLRSDGFKPQKGMCIYFDNSNDKNGKKYHSRTGCVVEGEDTTRLKDYLLKYKVLNIEEQLAVVAEFPYQNNFSMLSGMFRVYPAIKRYCKMKRFQMQPIIEIYDNSGHKITYIMPITTDRIENTEIQMPVVDTIPSPLP